MRAGRARALCAAVLIVGGCLAVTAVATTRASAQPGTLDTSFGTSGVAVSTLGGNAVGANGVTIVPTGVTGAGDIVTAGWSSTPRPRHSCKSPEFSSAGVLPGSQHRSSCNGKANAVTVLTSGPDAGRHRRCRLRVELQLPARLQPLVVPLTPRRVLDTTFGTRGIADPNAPVRRSVQRRHHGLQRQHRGRRILSGLPEEALVARFSFDGNPSHLPSTRRSHSTGYAEPSSWGRALGGELGRGRRELVRQPRATSSWPASGLSRVQRARPSADGQPSLDTNAGTSTPVRLRNGFVSTSVPNAIERPGPGRGGVAQWERRNRRIPGRPPRWSRNGVRRGTPDGELRYRPRSGTAGLEVGGGVVQWNSLVYEPVGRLPDHRRDRRGHRRATRRWSMGEYSGTDRSPATRDHLRQLGNGGRVPLGAVRRSERHRGAATTAGPWRLVRCQPGWYRQRHRGRSDAGDRPDGVGGQPADQAGDGDRERHRELHGVG